MYNKRQLLKIKKMHRFSLKFLRDQLLQNKTGSLVIPVPLGCLEASNTAAIHDVESFMVEAKEKIQLIEHINLLTLSQHIPRDSLQCRS